MLLLGAAGQLLGRVHNSHPRALHLSPCLSSHSAADARPSHGHMGDAQHGACSLRATYASAAPAATAQRALTGEQAHSAAPAGTPHPPLRRSSWPPATPPRLSPGQVLLLLVIAAQLDELAVRVLAAGPSLGRVIRHLVEGAAGADDDERVGRGAKGHYGVAVLLEPELGKGPLGGEVPAGGEEGGRRGGEGGQQGVLKWQGRSGGHAGVVLGHRGCARWWVGVSQGSLSCGVGRG